MPFAKCDTCKEFREEEKNTRDKELRKDLQRRYDAHLRDVEMERRAYYSNRLRGECEPEHYLSFIIDGADQADHQIPHFASRSHATSAATKQKLYLYGAISHGRKAYAFTVPAHVRQGHNVTIEVIWRVINDSRDSKGNLPPVLLLQLDNTTKQNKGKYLYAFLHLLVLHGVFRKIVVTYLPVGHTHEDIDQMFSRYAVHLRRRDAFTREQMGLELRKAYKYKGVSPDVVHLNTVANISGWFDSLKAKQIHPRGLPECMAHRHYRIVRDKDGKVITQARSSPIISHVSEPWQGLEGNTTQHDMFPDGAPDLVTAAKNLKIPPCARPEHPITREQVAEITKSISSLKEHLGDSFPDAAVRELTLMAGQALRPPLAFDWSAADIKVPFESKIMFDKHV